MVQAKPFSCVQHASAWVPSGVLACSSTISVPCTWFKNTGLAPHAAANCWRLCATDKGSSPTCSPKFRLSQGALETPPLRVLQHTRAPGQLGSAGRGSGFKVRAGAGLRLLESRQSHASVEHGHGAFETTQVHVETLGVEDLRHQHTVRHAGRVTVAKRARWRKGQLFFKSLQTL